MSSHRILYVGHDLSLLKTLREEMADCQMVRCPGGSVAHILIKSQINYSLFLLDEELPGTTGRELADLARGVQHRQHTPIMILSAGKARCAGAGLCFKQPDDLKGIESTIKQLLSAEPNAAG
jgi:DNA-binding response OmpR family regulator